MKLLNRFIKIFLKFKFPLILIKSLQHVIQYKKSLQIKLYLLKVALTFIWLLKKKIIAKEV